MMTVIEEEIKVLYLPGDLSFVDTVIEVNGQQVTSINKKPVEPFIKNGYLVLDIDKAVDHVDQLSIKIHGSNKWVEITESEYDEMLGCLPPEKFIRRDGWSMFRLCEYHSGNITSHYACVEGQYFHALRHVDFTYKLLLAQIKNDFDLWL